MKTKATLSKEIIEKARTRSMELETNNNKLAELFKRYREIYFMDNAEQPRNQGVGKDDWKITRSPSGRNEVTGMKRLMDTGEIHITVKSGGKTSPNSDKIEEGLKAILRVSGEYRKARIEKDANLSSVLFGPVVLMAESVDDKIAVQKNKVYKTRLEQIRKRTPFLLRAINAEESFADWGDFGILAHVWKYQLRGSILKERWGVEDVKDNLEYTVHDYLDLENRIVWSDELKDKVIYSSAHGMKSLNIVSRYAGGSSLFTKPEEQIQPFLYAKAKGELDKRENLFLTYLFTGIFMHGLPGPLMVVDPENVKEGSTFEINFQGGVRTMVAKAQVANYPVIDNDILQVKNILDELSEDSTIRSSTLGENIRGATFSALSMLSSAGKLPMVDPQEAVEMAFSDIFLHMLMRIKDEGIENTLIQSQDIPDDVEIEVTLEPKLPQDNLRNAQVAQNLGDLVSDEWKHTNLLQIGNSKEMHKEVMKEQIFKALVGALVQDQQLMQQLLQTAMGMPAQPQTPPPGPQGPTQQPDMNTQPAQGEVPPGYHRMPDGSIMSDAEMQQMQQQGPQGQAGMEQMPQSGPMIPPQERQ